MRTKAECRLESRLLRNQLNDDQYEQLNKQLLDNFKKVSIANTQYVHTFLPILAKREPNSYALIAYLQKAFPRVKIVISHSDVETNQMRHYLFRSDMRLMVNKWGIHEPDSLNEEEVAVEVIDMVLLPLLAFDMEGNRVGYGKGYYDVFLHACKKDVQKIGLSLFEPIDRIADVESHDIPLDMCVSPKQIWRFT